jgi:hypothetical protein
MHELLYNLPNTTTLRIEFKKHVVEMFGIFNILVIILVFHVQFVSMLMIYRIYTEHASLFDVCLLQLPPLIWFGFWVWCWTVEERRVGR